MCLTRPYWDALLDKLSRSISFLVLVRELKLYGTGSWWVGLSDGSERPWVEVRSSASEETGYTTRRVVSLAGRLSDLWSWVIYYGY